MRGTVEERLWANVEKTEGGCWLWTGARNQRGYGRIKVGGTKQCVHRVAYTLIKGAIPDGLDLDHTCHNDTDCPGGDSCLHRRCVNPDHLEPVTRRVNVLRSHVATAALHARKTECDHGHAYNATNTRYDERGWRVCRVCVRRSGAAYRQRLREAKVA